MEWRIISGGVTAPKGFLAAGTACGIKPSGKKEVALILSKTPCEAAGVFTRNLAKAAPIFISQEHLADGRLQGIVANSGNANALTPQGREHAKRMTQAAASATGLDPAQFGVASTGVIGVPLPMERVERGIAEAAAQLSENGSEDAAEAILTTDTRTKEISIEFPVDGILIRIGGIAKGSGMIHPNMGTTLCFLTTDCSISHDVLQRLLTTAVERSFNRITVDGDTSTNDTCLMLANGLAENPPLTWGTAACDMFLKALEFVCTELAKQVAGDGEGASRLVTVTVSGASQEEAAVRLARSVAGSSLVKAALGGADANWGRVLCAMGYAGVPFDPTTVSVTFASALGELQVCRAGVGVPFENSLARAILDQKQIEIQIELKAGTASATCWGCDLTQDYVRINGSYRKRDGQ